MAEDRFSLKDHLFNREKVSYLGDLLASGVDGFDRLAFEDEIMAEMLDLQLKERIALIARVMSNQLDQDFAVAAGQIRQSLPSPLDPTRNDDDFGDFIIAPFGKFVADHGLETPEVALPLLRDLTMRFSMEGPIRQFINRNTELTMETLGSWAHDENYHVRRLVSEGTRPRLPWAPRIAIAIEEPVPFLDELHSDPTRYVTRSVANHLNDISKVEPGLTIGRLVAWHEQGRQDPSELAWMTEHALRTLIKKGDPAAMTRLGFRPEADVAVSIDSLTPTVIPGDSLEFEVSLKSSASERLLVDYAIEFVKKSGERSTRVFKLRKIMAPAGERVVVAKRHRLRANATTYTLYPGTHRLTIMVNGRSTATREFEVAGSSDSVGDVL